MTQLERLLARIVQLVEDSEYKLITMIILVDGNGVPMCWQVREGKIEHLQDYENMVE